VSLDWYGARPRAAKLENAMRKLIVTNIDSLDGYLRGPRQQRHGPADGPPVRRVQP
jgi:hypothetical protein